MFSDTKNCPVCNSSNRQIINKKKISKIEKNFYVKEILKDLNIDYNFLQKKINNYLCKECFSIYHSPWFNEEVARKIFLTIYGQHNYGWMNLNNFVNKKVSVNHGNLFLDLKRITRFKSYAEYNCPFSGLFFDILLEEINNKNLIKKRFSDVQQIIHSKQDAFLNKPNKSLERKILNQGVEKIYDKSFFFGDDAICWGRNCISQNCNCAALGELFFNYNTHSFEDQVVRDKIDLFGIFMTLDHTYRPINLLKNALKISNTVLIHAHINPAITKQHLFTLGKKFLNFLEKNKFYCFDMTGYIEKDKARNKGKSYKEDEIYFVCSLKKLYINPFIDFYDKQVKKKK